MSEFWLLLFPQIALAAGVALGAAFDLRCRRIPNGLTLALALAGLIAAAVRPDITLVQSLAGFGIGLVVPFLLFALGMLGAGDAKLLAAIGAWVGPAAMLWVLLLTGVAGGVLALAMAIYQRRLLGLLRNTAVIGASLLVTRRTNWIPAAEAVRSNGLRRTTVPYAVAILVGLLATQSMLLLNVLKQT